MPRRPPTSRVATRLATRPRGRVHTLVPAVVFLIVACSGGGTDPGAPPGAPATATVAASPTPAPDGGNEPGGEPITQPFDLPILMYHDVAPVAPDDIYRAASNVLPDEFQRQLDYLICSGYTPVTVGDLLDAIAGASALPERPVVLTFDDGYENHYSEVFPRLRERGFVGSFAVITGSLGDNGVYMTWDNVREMSRAGMEIMSHTVSHVDLGTSDDATVRDQLTTSKTVLEQQTGRAVRALVYPAGEPFRSGTESRQSEVVALAQEAGYEAALLAGPSTTAQDPAAPFTLNRVRISAGEDISSYAASIGGPPPGDCT